MSIYIGDKEIKNLYVGGSTSVSDMQGPAPDGFHVPSSDEWVALCGVLTTTFGLENNATTMGTYLKIPVSGYRNYGAANIYGVDTGWYWSSTPYDADYAYRLTFNSSDIRPQVNSNRASGFAVRCFKDTPTVPTSSWTTLYQGTGSAGVFYNASLGLISVSGDGTTWYTIMDKNLGATTVYNQGDTVTDTNCGYFYQRGNNYGFAHSGTVTTSSTQVDASNYGPGNYYSSNKFITGSANWSSVQNDNLWGGVTGVKPTEVKAVYLGENKVRPSGPDKDYLCFTANTAGSTIKLQKVGSPTTVTLETSIDGDNRTTYTIGNTITLTNVGDKVYWRNKSETDTGFSISTSSYYRFAMTGTIAASGDVNYLLNKNSTDTVSAYAYNTLFDACPITTTPELLATNVGQYGYRYMFGNCTSLTTLKKIYATTINRYSFTYMFYGCKNLTVLPKLPSTQLQVGCYERMFNGCSKIKLSATQTGDYQTPYRIPTEGTGTSATDALKNMFYSTGGTTTTSVSINTTYYTSNTVV